MEASYNRFQNRLRRIEGAHEARADAGVTVRPDGLIVPRRRTRIRLSVPWRSLALAVVCCLLLKSFMIWHQGEADYAARLADLEGRSAGHSAAAWVLSMDPVSLWLARSLTDFVGHPPV